MESISADNITSTTTQYSHLDDSEEERIKSLLNQYLDDNQKILVQKTNMGGTEAYVSSVTLEWFANQVKFASSLPLLHRKYNSQSGNIDIDAETIDEIQQRPLDWSRQISLVQYLATRKHHKFPPVLVVVSPSWVDNPKAKEWDKKGRAKKSAIAFTPLDIREKFGLINLQTDLTIYALDGQHRLMGVQGLIELLKTGEIPRYRKDKTTYETNLKLEDLIEKFSIKLTDIQNLPQETIGIEFISAVVAGETREEARKRVRSIFVHVNLMATPLSKGQLAQLNEDNGFAIIARKIAVTHPLLKQRDKRNPRVNWNSATIATKSTVLTTLQALTEMSERYLGHKFPHWKAIDKSLVPLRPDDEELSEGIDKFNQLFDCLASLPSYQIIEHADTPSLRRFSFEKDEGEGNMLFRPVGQIALAQALGILVFQKGFTLEDIFKKLRIFDQKGGFTAIEFPQSLWYGILYDPNKRRIQVSGKELAARLLVYILGGIQEQMERAELRKDLAKCRTFENRTISFEGKFVEPKKVGLPEILS
ncbi:DGQHR domain-containing protein [Calothrix sp. 336/3]|uniref:DGQHR domain-containing protein n=1 Tax=Calothrix sp. 336/3 TaxID=1337936 RepID=UPI0004E3B196|nr:DGQHR domain-containing protein [Calothrix sp. 336/3]AKG22164.1 DGQHR domain-containing protein [Calothrix sp. 336/3]